MCPGKQGTGIKARVCAVTALGPLTALLGEEPSCTVTWHMVPVHHSLGEPTGSQSFLGSRFLTQHHEYRLLQANSQRGIMWWLIYGILFTPFLSVAGKWRRQLSLSNFSEPWSFASLGRRLNFCRLGEVSQWLPRHPPQSSETGLRVGGLEDGWRMAFFSPQCCFS